MEEVSAEIQGIVSCRIFVNCFMKSRYMDTGIS